MKPSTKATTNLLSGIALLLSAAFFTICLLLQLFDFGSFGQGNIVLNTGKMLYAVYGFSSILIPVFLLISGLLCFASKWTARKAFRLLTAVVPFFTCVFCEKIIRSVIDMGYNTFPIVRVVITLATGIMLVIIEFVAEGIIADKINGKSKLSKKSPSKAKKLEEESDDDEIDFDDISYEEESSEDESKNENETEPKLKKKQKRKSHYFDIDDDDTDETELELFDEPEENSEEQTESLPVNSEGFTEYSLPSIT
ncbi:MAG: hypothetical protein HUK25_01655, partial [Treponema sp.]|nr:hypothetical protein [Treponema sp.]